MMMGRVLAIVAVVATALFVFEALSTLEAAVAVDNTHDPVPSSTASIPNFGLGTWLSDRDKVSHAVEYALDDGYRHIDAAMIYRNEDKVGAGIAASKVDREDIWVTSKLWNTDHRPDAVRAAADKTIADLGVGYLDLYLVHWPVAFVPGTKKELDTETTLADTWRAMEELVRSNVTRRIGISNFAPADVDAVLAVCDVCPYAHELETHPYLQQQAFVDWHLAAGIRVIAYSPLANTNPHYRSGTPPIMEDPFWTALAAKKNATVAQAVLAWGMQRGTVVIPKSVHEGYIDENLDAVDVTFSELEMAEVASHDRKMRFNDPGQDWGVDLFRGLDDPTRRDGEL